MTQSEFDVLARDYNRQTAHHSFAHMNRRTPAYSDLIRAGLDVVPFIIEAFEQYRGEKFYDPYQSVWGMNWVVILMDLTHHTPIHPEPVAGGHMVAWRVEDTCKAWIKWYRDNSGAGNREK